MDIKKGYNLVISSYEGDADNYNTTINTFSSKEECIFYTKLAIALGHGEHDFSETCVEIYESILSEYGTDDIKKEYAGYKLASDDIYILIINNVIILPIW